ncbi:MAG: hypothetical protein A2X18_13400 [Bacteroidetes bacterium GWF2_40_14]|nr:MAG: hypothetical protein A2X18_13400 [Bacteroidetes bacterium GWF2_40_14]
MKLQTKIEIKKSASTISYSDKVLFIGSCFANEVGSIMKNLRFDVIVNPFGVLYNPASIAESLERLVSGRHFENEDFIKCDDIYKSFSHSSDFSAMCLDELRSNVNRQLDEASIHFKQSKWIILSLGTRWIYRLCSNGKVVANCQKLPPNRFEREPLDVDDVVRLLSPLIAENPMKNWILTVSPVRHWKDGAHGNQLSKAVLLLSIEKLQNLHENVHYFPAYEILLDELRDYRFYSEDMLHPSGQAVNHIWNIFSDIFMDLPSLEFMKIISKLNTMDGHRPFFPDSKSYVMFDKERKELEKAVKEKLEYFRSLTSSNNV